MSVFVDSFPAAQITVIPSFPAISIMENSALEKPEPPKLALIATTLTPICFWRMTY